MKVKSLIFDLDGTLWDPIDTCVEAWNEMILARNNAAAATIQHSSKTNLLKAVTRQDFLASMGKNHLEIRNIYFSHLPIAERESLLQDCYLNELKYIYQLKPPLYPQVAEGLKTLSKNYELSIVSNCQRDYLNAFLELYAYNNFFTHTLCYGDTELSKGENIIQVIGNNPLQSAAYIGDTAGDQSAAEYAHLPFYYASYGYGVSTNYIHKFDNFNELVNYFISKDKLN